MRAFVIRHDGKIIGYARTQEIAQRSLAISWSAYQISMNSDLASITIVRKGFPPVRYTLEPIEVLERPEHL